MYRIHDKPDPDRVENLRSLLDSIGIKLSRGKVPSAGDFNKIVEKARSNSHSSLVSEAVLRCQSQAAYSPENVGHFGLGLRRYAHFTSPIRRYSDLLVHRALITGLDFGDGGLGQIEDSRFHGMAQSISDLERRAVAAERDAADRLTVAYLADRTGEIFDAKVSGVTRFGAFVSLTETGANGLIPLSALGEERIRVDEQRQALVGVRGRTMIRMGDALKVRLLEANSLTGSLIFETLKRKNNGRIGTKFGKKGRNRTKRKRRPK
jgi:ribonuclease R